MQGITTFFWFNTEADDAARHYVKLFEGSNRAANTKYGSPMTGPDGAIIAVDMVLDGTNFVALNGGPTYAFTPATSFAITCETQDEIDYFWDAFLDGGDAMQCGWVTDKFGITWQVVPAILPQLLGDSDRAKAGRAMEAMMKMVKFDIAALKAAFNEAQA